ncbi:LPD38 domain-containing protein [Vibrio navarrensis]|uniref:LPD38 domain-containing protein n=1 Tax=Vibrio navarrensis TaxID=29495 RepID=UPI001D05A3D4|nr:LPD38 domain-containing protein [Vibrio navarrensis]MBE4617393.1 hypothetical protein [Vibrio navarrensis]
MQDKQLLGQNMNSKATVNAKTDMSQEPFLPEGFTFKHSPAPLKDLDVSGMDYVKAAGSGALRSIAGVGELAENYLGVGESLRDVATSGADYLQESMTPDAQEAMTRELYTENGSGPFGLGLGNGAGDIDVWAVKIANGIGSLAATFAGGGVAGAGAKTLLRGTITKSMMKKGLTEEVAQAVADKAIKRIAATGAAGAGFGASLGGASMDARDAVMNMDSAWLYENSDFFRDALMRVSDHPENQNLSATELFDLAKEETANHASLQMSSDPKAIAASVVSALGDKVLFNAITGTLGKSIIGGALKGAATEASTEALESGTQTYAQNQILNDVAGTNIDPWSGVKSAAAEGGTIGAIVGGVPGAIGGYRGKHSANESSDLAPEQMPIPDDQSEVVNELASQLRGSSSNEASNIASETIPEGATPIPEEIAPVMSDLGAQLRGDEDAPVSQPLSQDPSIPQPEVKVPQPDDGNQVLNAQETVASEPQADGITEQFKAMMYAAEQADPNRSKQIIKALKSKNTTTTEKIELLKEFRALASSQSPNEMSQDIPQPASIQPEQEPKGSDLSSIEVALPQEDVPTFQAKEAGENAVASSAGDQIENGEPAYSYAEETTTPEITKPLQPKGKSESENANLAVPPEPLEPAEPQLQQSLQSDVDNLPAVEQKVELPEILRASKKQHLKKMAKAKGLKESSPGYAKAMSDLETEYESNYDLALAQLPFEQYQQLNSDTPESINRQAHQQLQEEFGVKEKAISFSRESVLSHVPAKGMAIKEAELAADQWLKTYKGGAGVDIKVVKTQAEAEAIMGARFEGALVGALYSDAKRLAVVVADNIESPKDLRHKLRHEVLVHHGLRAVVGDMEYMKIMERIARGKNSPYLKELWDTVERNYKGFEPLYQVEEVLAHAAEIERPAIKRWFDSIVELIAHALRRVGLMNHSDMTKAEMYNIVQTLSDRIKSVNQWKDRTRPEAQNVETKLSQTLFSKNEQPSKEEVIASGGNDSGPRLLPLEPDNNTSRVAEANKSVSIEDKAVKGVSNNTKGEDLKFSRKVKEQTLTPELAEKLGLGPKKSKAELAKEFTKELVGKSKAEWFELFQERMKRVNTGWFDGLAPIKYAEDKAGITNAEDSGYVAARLAAGSSSVMQAVMLYGIPEWKDGIIQKRDNTGEADSLLGIFDELGKDLHNWLAWMAGNRAKQLKTQGRENLLSEDEINELLLLGEGKQEAFKRAKAKYNAMNKALLDLAQDAGLIDKDSRNKWESEWYVPFYRQDDKANEKGLDSVIGPWKGRGIANQSAQIKKLKGSDKNVNDILENIFINTGKLVDASMKNMAMQKVVYNLADTDLIEVVPKPNLMQFKAADAVHVKVEGEDYLVKVSDADLFRAMTQIDMERSNHPFMKVARGAKRLLTSTVTVSPDFMLRNFLRDSLSSWAISKDGFTPIIDSLRGAKKTIKKEAGTLDMMFSGASFLGGYVNGNDPQAMADSVRKALKRKGLSEADIRKYQNSLITDKSQLMGALSKGWDKYIEFGEGLENASREAVYEAAIKSGKTKAQAVFEAKDLMDFSLHGNSKVAMFLGDVLPFFNARLQGLGKLAREAKANPVQIAQRGGMIAAASVALVLINGNDERYQELPDWDKDMNWHFWFGDQHWRVPKPFEIGVLFGTFPERIVNAAFYEDSMEDLRNAFGRNLVSTFALNPVPQVVNPLVEAYFNYSMFRGQPIENIADLSMMPEARYNERTSITMREIGELTGMSPKKLEHIFNGYLGTVGSYTLWMSDYVARQMGDYGAKPALKAQDLLVIKSVYQGSDRARSTKYLDDMYKMMREAEELYRTVNEYRKDGRFERARELMEDRGKILNARKPLKETQKQVRQLNSQIDLIMRSKELTAEEKRKRIDRKIEQRNAIVAATVKRVNSYFD